MFASLYFWYVPLYILNSEKIVLQILVTGRPNARDECHPDWTPTLHLQKSVTGYSDQQKKTILSRYLRTKEKEQRNAPPKKKYRKQSVRQIIYFKMWTYPTSNDDLFMFRIIKLIMWLGHCLLKWMLMVEKRIWTKKKLYVILHLTIIKLASM